MDTDEIVRRIWKALSAQALLPMRNVTFADGSAPDANWCKPDVHRWTSENPDNEPVHGWLAIGPGGLLLQKHWFVKDPKGQLFNITSVDKTSQQVISLRCRKPLNRSVSAMRASKPCPTSKQQNIHRRADLARRQRAGLPTLVNILARKAPRWASRSLSALR